MPRYIIVTDTMCGDSYEWTTDDDGNEVVYTYDSEEHAEKELAIDIEAINEHRDPEDYVERDEYWIELYDGTQTEEGRGNASTKLSP